MRAGTGRGCPSPAQPKLDKADRLCVTFGRPLRRKDPMRRISAVLVSLLAVAAVAAGCGSSSGSSSSGGAIRLVAYSTPKEAYAALIPAFQATAGGKDATFTPSYGASGHPSRAVDQGPP